MMFEGLDLRFRTFIYNPEPAFTFPNNMYFFATGNRFTFGCMRNFHIHITGKVQKTGFHYFVKQLAQMNNINGFVNKPDEDGIIIEAEGREPDLNRFIEFCLEGPTGAVVSSTTIKEGTIKSHNSFSILDTSPISTENKLNTN